MTGATRFRPSNVDETTGLGADLDARTASRSEGVPNPVDDAPYAARRPRIEAMLGRRRSDRSSP
jgi:hypothetical protein